MTGFSLPSLDPAALYRAAVDAYDGAVEKAGNARDEVVGFGHAVGRWWDNREAVANDHFSIAVCAGNLDAGIGQLLPPEYVGRAKEAICGSVWNTCYPNKDTGGRSTLDGRECEPLVSLKLRETPLGPGIAAELLYRIHPSKSGESIQTVDTLGRPADSPRSNESSDDDACSPPSDDDLNAPAEEPRFRPAERRLDGITDI